MNFQTNAQFHHPQVQAPAPQMGPPPDNGAAAAMAQHQANMQQSQHLAHFNQVQGANLQQQADSGIRQMGAPIYPSVATVPPTQLNQGPVPQAPGFHQQQPQLQTPGGLPPAVQQNPQMLQQPGVTPNMPAVQQIPGQQPQIDPNQQFTQQQPGQQQMPQQFEPGQIAEEVVGHYAQQGVDPDFLDALTEEAHRQGVPEAELAQHVDQAFQAGVQNFGSAENYQEYMDRVHDLNEYLGQQYGNEAQNVLNQALENIEAQGGEALLNKFLYDPEMLDPNIILPYLEGDGGGEGQNPYMQYAAPNNRGYSASVAGQQGAMGQTATPAGRMGGADIDGELHGLMNPQTKEAVDFLQSPAGQQRRLELMVAKNKMARQYNGMY